ncbi:MAG TPA: endonuclease/exonuclease/phosphatase family protein [Gaiellaceae bacterium]
MKAGGSARTTCTGTTVERLLVRTWNLFHGNAVPPERVAFLAEMVRLATADRPDVLCLQELPVWALERLEGWSRMIAVTAVASRPMLGPLPGNAEVGRLVTKIDHGLFRSAFTGQANAVLLAPALQVLERREVVLNPYGFRRVQARRLGLAIVPRLVWSKERRMCQVVRVRRDEGTVVLANLHATGSTDKRIPDAELLRAAVFVDGVAEPGEPVVLAGDFNIGVTVSQTLADLTSEEWGFEGPTSSGIDHVLVRGLRAGPPVRWGQGRRALHGRLLSDHAPVDRELE